MASSKLFVVLKVILISIILLLAFQVAARELVETSSALNPYHKMERELVDLEDDAPARDYNNRHP